MKYIHRMMFIIMLIGLVVCEYMHFLRLFTVMYHQHLLHNLPKVQVYIVLEIILFNAYKPWNVDMIDVDQLVLMLTGSNLEFTEHRYRCISDPILCDF